uniref:PDZ domain-containing protein n=1 Tax=Monopterus albus TaxID=43700 RepID=A0A3Q3ILS7_MONAL
MGTGNYICVTLLGGAPWGFTLREEEGDTYRPLLISQGGRAFLAGVQEGDEVVSLNGNPSADLTLLRAFALIDTSINCLQLLLKRDSSAEALKSTTLHIFSPKHRSQSPKELNISESQDKTYYGDLDSDIGFRKGHQLHAPSSGDQRGSGSVLKENDEEIRQCFSPGDVIELQLSLSKQTLDDVGSTSLGSARGIEGEPSNREALEKIHTNTTSHYVPCSVREPLGQHGVVLSSPSVLGQVEVILQQPAASGAGRGGPRISRSGGSQGKGEEGGGHHKGVPGSFTVSFEIPSEETTPAEELDSDSEGDRDKPNKHRPRHARLRRSESLSEKQVKEAKSKCKHIALLLTAAPPNPNNKGVLMFKKHRQRAKKYTLVSYGTGEDQPEYSDEEDEEEGDNQATHTVKFTLVAPSDSDVDKDFLTNAHSSKAVLAITLDKGLLDIEKNLNSQAEMECLPETKGKGALMFAKRRQRMDEISAEHEELRRQGIPVEGGHEAEKKTVEQSYMQSTTEGHAYMDYSAAVNGTLQHQTSEMHTSFSNRTAKPFSVQNMVATPYSPAVSGTSQDSVGQGEQIASRDERISTPAIRSGLLMDARKRSTGKPMFTFKEAPKVSPNPELLTLEDYLSLGAEACNFLQSARFKHKTPPPVAPKPMINPSSPPCHVQPQEPLPHTWTPQIQPSWSQSQGETQTQTPAQPSWAQPREPARSEPQALGQRASSSINPMASVLIPSSSGSAYEMPAVRGKGADMFAKRQSRMEKFIVDSNGAGRPPSPAASLPNEWKYTSSVRAPPSRSYNPIQSPSYPPAATKQPPSSSISSKAKKKEKQMPARKPLSVVEVMKHKPHQLSSSLFTFGPAAEVPKPPVPRPDPSPPNPPAESQSVKYEPESAPGRSYSLSPPVRIPSTGQRSASFSPKPLTSLEKGHKPLTPWEAASRHPLGLVDEAFTVQNFQQTLASNICLAAQRKLLPEPPVEWKPRVSHQAPKKTGSQTWSQSQSHSKSRAPLPSFMSPTKCTVSAVPDGYRSAASEACDTRRPGVLSVL